MARRLIGFLASTAPLAALIAFSSAYAAPITFNTALPVSKDELIYRQQLVVTRASDERGGVAREVAEITGVSVVGFGATGKLALFGVLPVIHRDRDIGSVETSEFGLGDAAVFARHEIYRRDSPGGTLRLAPFAGVTVPTGERGETGDGAVDVFGGLILTRATTDWAFDGQIQYVVNNEADGFERGDAASLDASLQYRLFPASLGADGGSFLFAVLEANVAHFEKDKAFGIVDSDSGGLQAFLSPGLQYAAKRWIAEAAVRVPVVNDLNGAALEPDYSVIAGLRFNF